MVFVSSIQTRLVWKRYGATTFLVRPRRPSIAGGSGAADAHDATLRLRIREMLERGELPRSPGKLWAGKGSGRPCAICGEGIEPGSVEFETDTSRSLVVHQTCHTLWVQEATRTP